MRAVVLRSLAVIGVGGLVLVGVLYFASTVDARAPTVTAISLTQPLPDDPAQALITTSLEIAFSELVETTSAAEALTIEPEVAGSVSWSGSTMIFTPADPLELASSYAVSVGTGVRDLSGNAMTELPEPFAFETAGAPAVVETTPADGADDVALADPIAITFSTLMDTASVDAALDVRPAFPHELQWSGTLLEIVPDRPLVADREYEIRIGDDAIDVAGVALEAPLTFAFRTVAPGLEAELLVPADGTDGVARTSPIAVVLDGPIDPDSIADGLLTITPEVAGTLAVVDERGAEPAEPRDGTVLQFTPSGLMPANTTIDVDLGVGIAGLESAGLAQPIAWSFTTGPPQSTLSNQVTFLSDRSGVANLWTVNPDGSAARQLSAELAPALDYAVAPDGSSFVVGDGRQLILVDAASGERRVLTDDGLIEFDPTYSPDGQRIAFARADAATGDGLGIWERPIGGGDAARLEVDSEPTDSPVPSASGEAGVEPQWLRAPRYAPDGEAIAFVDLDGSVGIVDRAADRLTRVTVVAASPVHWMPDSSELLVVRTAREPSSRTPSFDAPVEPMETTGRTEVALLDRSDGRLERLAVGDADVAAVASDGRVAYIDGQGALRIAESPDARGEVPPGMAGDTVAGASFAPGENAIAVTVVGSAGDDASGRIDRVDLDGGDAVTLTDDGRRPRWLP